MITKFIVNGNKHQVKVKANDKLLEVLRTLGYFGVKHGCESGECGACAVLIDGKTINSCVFSALQADGKNIETIESVGEHPNQGWKETEGLHPIQKAFAENGAIQCGFCTPAMVLAAKELIDENPNPSEGEVKEAMSGVMCRCTGFEKPIKAVLQASAEMRGEAYDEKRFSTAPVIISENKEKYISVGTNEIKVDAVKLVQGKPAFTADIELKGMLTAKVLRSPHAHANIKKIDASKARALEGVAAVLTHEDLPRVAYSTAGQSDPIPGPLDMFSLDNKVRYAGDRVAFVAAENEEIANKALSLIEVEYEVLPNINNYSDSLDNEIILHEEEDYVNFDASDASRNLAAHIHIDIGDVEAGFAEADRIFEHEYEVPKVQQAHIEPHVAVTYWDEDDRLVIRTSTQVPFHVRRMMAPVLGLPVKRIRVVKPRIGGGFGGKQEVQIEDVAAHLTIATGRPVKFETTREEEFTSSRSRHPMKIKMKTGVDKDGNITANAMYCLSDTGAYGCHALTVTGNTGHKAMALYVGDGKYRKNPNIQFIADIVYSNQAPSGAFRGYGVPQGYWAVERHMEHIADEMGFDPIKFRLQNALRPGELQPFSTAWSEGREPSPEIVETNALEQCVEEGLKAIEWDKKYQNQEWQNDTEKPWLKRGVGVAMMMQGTAIPYLDMGAASIKMNDDGSFNLLVGATDLGTGSDTVLAQMAAEVLGVPVEDIIVYSSDTDFTPFDVGAYASSTTYISGAAVVKAAQKVARMMSKRAAMILNVDENVPKVDAGEIHFEDRKALALDGRFVTLEKIALHSLHHANQEQIMAVASHMSEKAPPPFAAQFAEVTVDTQTGMVEVDKLVMAVDSGVIVNPITASGQIEGGMIQALGYALTEEMIYNENGQIREKDFKDYHIFSSTEIPEMKTIFVETFESSHPFGVKAVAEIPMDGVAPAVANAIKNACGAELDRIPATPERVWKALKERK